MHRIHLDSLNSRFGRPGQLAFKTEPGSVAVAEIDNELGSARIALQGAQLLTWTPRGEKPVVWLSPHGKLVPGKSARGGVPVCWPWFGPHPAGGDFPSHGFARTAPWEVLDTEFHPDGSTELTFSLLRSDTDSALWPHSTPLTLRVRIGSCLSMELRTRNIGAAPATIGQALHTYFEISDIRQARVLGLEDCEYLDKVGGGRKHQDGPVNFSGETDRIYLDTTAECIIEDPGYARRIHVTKRGSRSTVVWNPWIEKAAKLGDLGEDGYLRMLCVESTNAADDLVTLPPGQEHVLAVEYRLSTLP
ncbi:MAG: D-hexose-6-phosphate mutarotase [Methylococcaceae bacterium]|nr:D-hexose-6-phosphate mutarotase [Methylococcaceae bacterium]